MRRPMVAVLALALLFAPQWLEAQQGGGMMGRMMQGNPLELVLLRADSLGLELTAEQTAQITVIKDELDEKNAPHQAQLTRLMGQMQGSPDMSLMQQIQTHAQAMQQENQAALQAAREGVFTAQQWTTVDAFLQSRQPQGRGGGGFGGGPGGGFPG